MGHRAEEIRALGGQVLAVAVTATLSHQAFVRSLRVGFPLLSDWDEEVCRAYGVQYDVWKGHRGLAQRSVFVVDPGQVVRYRWVTDDALVLPDLDGALAVLRQCANAPRRPA